MELRRGNCTIGSDPELFVTIQGKRPISADRVVLADGTSNAAVIYDNVAIELRPVSSACSNYVQDNISELLINDVRPRLLALEERNGERPDTLDLTPVREFPAKELRRKAARTFGCSPSMLQNGDVSVPSCDPTEIKYRCIGHHVHLGDSFFHKKEMKKHIPSFTHLLDCTLGILGVLWEDAFGWTELGPIRRMEIGYGRAGEHRLPKHGYEYRTLGPWPTVHPALAHLAWVTARDILGLFQQAYNRPYGMTTEQFSKDKGIKAKQNLIQTLCARYDRGMIEDTINTSNVASALQVRNDMRKYLSTEEVTASGYSCVFFVPYNWRVTDRMLKEAATADRILRTVHSDYERYKDNYFMGAYRSDAARINIRILPETEGSKPTLFERWNAPSHIYGWSSFCRWWDETFYENQVAENSGCKVECEDDDDDDYYYDEDEDDEW